MCDVPLDGRLELVPNKFINTELKLFEIIINAQK